MARSIYLKQSDGSLQAMTEAPFAAEDVLQELLEKYPNLLAGDQIDGTDARQWLLVAREFGVPDDEGAPDRFSLDHLFLDQDGIPTLVEVKRSSDTRIRREVVGQMFDYAANAVVYWPPDHLRLRFEAACEARQEDAAEAVSKFLGDESGAGDVVQSFWEQVKTNLQAGKIRLIFVADQIPSELRRIIEFLNRQMGPAEVLGVEVRQFLGGDQQTLLVPQVIGRTAAAEQKKGQSPPRDAWTPKTPERLLAYAIETCKLTAEQVAALKRLLDFSLQRSDRIGWGSGKTPAFSPRFLKVARRSLYTAYADGNLSINFGWLNVTEEEKKFRERLADQLKTIPVFNSKIKEADGYAVFSIAEWSAEVDKFIAVIEKLIG